MTYHSFSATTKKILAGKTLFFPQSLIFILISFIIGLACNKTKNSYTTSGGAPMSMYRQTNLVSDTAGFNPAFIDPKLVNAWGIASNPGGILWITANHQGLSTVYDSTGAKLFGPVAIPSQGIHFGGAPTGVIFNSTADFVIPGTGKPAFFVFAGEDGTISAWNTGDSTLTVADRSASGAVYKGIALANDGSANFLYLANFKGQKIDVFDKSFTYVTSKPFADPNIPAGFSPFNVQNIGNKLYVTYAKLKAPDNQDDQSGPGNGYVDIFNPDGTLVQRFASQGTLNSPWAIAQVPVGFKLPVNSILIGNFGDGRINIYDPNGNYQGQLQNKNGGPIAIEGLWGLLFPYSINPKADPNKLYFTAGPQGENHGLFGYLSAE